MFRAGVDKSEIVNFLREKLANEGIHEKLTIIDPYFFSRGKFGDTQDVINEILSPLSDSIKELEIVTSKRNYNKTIHDTVSKKLYFLRINVIHENDFHDRFWIIDERKAFVVGTSINSFGNKHFYIQDDFLSQRDTESILSFYKHSLPISTSTID
jgi:hypothetical protein